MGKLNQMALEQKEKEIQLIVKEMENEYLYFHGPDAELDMLEEQASEEWDRRNEVEIG
tara:strand:- start:46 stop:219 length:174 start_codon:yes stop_codon:yes gene_type:complete